MKKLTITITVISIIILSHFFLCYTAYGAKANTWCAVYEIKNNGWGAHQDEANVLIAELEVIDGLRSYLADRLVNFDHNDYGKFEKRKAALTYLTVRVNMAYISVIDAITIFVKNHTGY